ncbi:hypothetical protein GCM10027061_09600 [Nesterenkonia suensis]
MVVARNIDEIPRSRDSEQMLQMIAVRAISASRAIPMTMARLSPSVLARYPPRVVPVTLATGIIETTGIKYMWVEESLLRCQSSTTSSPAVPALERSATLSRPLRARGVPTSF